MSSFTNWARSTSRLLGPEVDRVQLKFYFLNLHFWVGAGPPRVLKTTSYASRTGPNSQKIALYARWTRGPATDVLRYIILNLLIKISMHLFIVWNRNQIELKYSSDKWSRTFNCRHSDHNTQNRQRMELLPKISSIEIILKLRENWMALLSLCIRWAL
jgi:hypothetical protein